LQFSATSPHQCLATGVDALRVDQGRLHRSAGSQAASSVEGANVCHRSPSDGDNRSSTARRMLPLPTEDRINVGNEPHAGTHDRCTHGAALVETTSPALLTQRDGCDCAQQHRCSALGNAGRIESEMPRMAIHVGHQNVHWQRTCRHCGYTCQRTGPPVPGRC
jgi:hypothetical protein